MTAWLAFILAHKAAVVAALGILGAFVAFAGKVIEVAKSLLGKGDKKTATPAAARTTVSGVGNVVGDRNTVSVSVNEARPREARAAVTRLSCHPERVDLVLTTIAAITLVNKGDVALTLVRLELVIHGSATMKDCNNRLYSVDEVKWTYDMDVDERVLEGVHSLSPGEADSFTVRFGRKHGGPTLTTYAASLRFVFDEPAATFESEPFHIDMTGPRYIQGATHNGVSKRAWSACQAENIREFEKIGRDIRDQFDPRDLPDIEEALRSGATPAPIPGRD